jgi:hypothetical protein
MTIVLTVNALLNVFPSKILLIRVNQEIKKFFDYMEAIMVPAGIVALII